MLLLCRGLARLKEEVQVGSTASMSAMAPATAGKSPSQTLADFQRLAEEVAKLQLSIQVTMDTVGQKCMKSTHLT